MVIGLLFLVALPVQGADTDTRTDTQLQFNGARYEPEDSTVKNTYDLPDLDSGFAYDFETNRLRPVLGFEVYDGLRAGLGYPVKLNTGVAEDLAFTSATVRFTSIIEFSAGVFAGYDVDRREHVAGPIILITKF